MDSLSVHATTWNVAARDFPSGTDVTNLLGGLDNFAKRKTDIFVVGYQEVSARIDKFLLDTVVTGDDPCSLAVRKLLEPYDYVKVRTNRLLGIVLNVFCLRKHLAHLRNIETQYTRLSLSGYWGFKGAVSVRFEIYGVSYCFVNSHLSAHDHLLQQRINEYNTIIETHKFKSRDASNILYHDYIVWLGDLNFRLIEGSLTHEEIVDKIAKNQIEELLKYDQLSHVRKEELAFHELTDVTPTFAPTYKFVMGSDEYDEKRRPAFTDRILYRVNSYNYENLGPEVVLSLKIKNFGSQTAPQFRCSDHRPVSLSMETSIFSKELADQKYLMAYGPVIHFIRPEEPWYVNEDGKLSYLVDVNAGQLLDNWDWIGLFHESFTALEDYVTFCWSSPCRRTGIPKQGVISDAALFAPGKFVLIYISVKGSILGISQPISVEYRKQYSCDQTEVEEAEEAKP